MRETGFMMKEMTAYACDDDRTLPYLYLHCCSAQL
jgi:hypothetical protein